MVVGGAASVAIALVAGVGGSTADPMAGAIAPSLDSPPTVSVTATSGPAGAGLTASGTGCDGGLVGWSLDGHAQSMPVFTGNGGSWSVSLTFPAGEGDHTLGFACHEWSTVGAPTTFLALGELRFAYDPVTITTVAGTLVPGTTAPPVTTPPPAEPTDGSPSFTG
jgi:hypothetical protein